MKTEDLTPEDRQRIEQEALDLLNDGSGDYQVKRIIQLLSAEYENKYQRESSRIEIEALGDLVRINMKKVDKLEAERSELINLLRETVMRGHFAMPENDQDVEWFEEKRSNDYFVEQIFTVLQLGKLSSLKK